MSLAEIAFVLYGLPVFGVWLLCAICIAVLAARPTHQELVQTLLLSFTPGLNWVILVAGVYFVTLDVRNRPR